MRDYLSEMLYALTSAYSRKDYDNHQQGRPMETNIGKLFSLFAWGLNIVHENAELVKQWDDLEWAKGTVLDRYGANWGVKRFNENDALYRLAIKVKVMSQLSGGDTDTVIRAAADLLGVQNPDIEFEDVFPAKIALYVDWLLLTPERQDLIEPIAWAIKRIIAAGVGMRLYVRTYRTYRRDLPICHAGAIGANIIAAPVNQDRESIVDIGVGFGAFMEVSLASHPIGMDRTGRESFGFLHGGKAQADFAVSPVGEDRAGYEAKQVHSGTLVHPDLTTPPVGEDRESQRTVTAIHAAADVPLVKGRRDRRESASGTMYRTHIKPKRID